jgi:hypothetical protein
VIFKDEAARDAYLPRLLQQVHVAKLLPMLESGIEGTSNKNQHIVATLTYNS